MGVLDRRHGDVRVLVDDAGADVVASARRAEQVESTAAEIESKGRRALRITSDVADRASLQNLLDQTLAHLGKADILVNCAGKIKRAPTLDFPEDEWQSILDTNLTGTLLACPIGNSSNGASVPPGRQQWNIAAVAAGARAGPRWGCGGLRGGWDT